MKMERVAACSIAEEFDIHEMMKHFAHSGYEPRSYDGVIHIKKEMVGISPHTGHVFYFPYGSMVCWGFSEPEEAALLEAAMPYAVGPLPAVNDVLHYSYDAQGETHIVEEDNHFIIGNENLELVMLSFSHALSQSVKLIMFEESVLKTIRNTHYLTENLATSGKISMSRKKLARKIGALFVERHSINLHGDILDTPEFFWRRPRFEPFYHMAAEFLDIKTRVQILNRRGDVVYELYSLLSGELHHSHSLRLEWVIILLISLEVILVMLEAFFSFSSEARAVKGLLSQHGH